MPKNLEKHSYMKVTKHFTNPSIQWHIVDAKGQVLGRLATQIARLLRGKHKVEWSPHINSGDFVVLINADQISLSGRKWTQKSYHSHSRYIGSLKETKAQNMDPSLMVVRAVQGMLPKNKTRKQFLKKLKIYPTDKHPHEAQNLIPFKISR